MHHWEDVFVGGLLGLVVATLCYLQFFPPPYHDEGGIPADLWSGWGHYAFFRVLEESRASTQPANTVDTQNVIPAQMWKIWSWLEGDYEGMISKFFLVVILGSSSLYYTILATMGWREYLFFKYSYIHCIA